MFKRYMIVIIVLIALIGCFFMFFDKPTTKELYSSYVEKLDKVSEYDFLSENEELNINVENGYYNNQYHYVVTFTANANLSNFKAMVIDNNKRQEYYPSFGIIDNKNIDLVNGSVSENQTKGVNLVVSYNEKIEALRIYVSYNNQEYYYFYAINE